MNDKINPYMKVQIKNQILEAENFILLLKDAAKKDDGLIDSDEEKLIKKLEKATEKYVKEMKEWCE